MQPRSSLTLAVSLFLLAPALARATEFSEFRIPRHKWLAWNASVDGYASSRRQHYEPGTSFNDYDRYLGHLASSARWFLDSEELQVDAVLLGRTDASRDIDQVVYDYFRYSPGTREERATNNRAMEESLYLSGGVRAYPFAPPVAFSIRFDGNGNWLSHWNHSRRVNLDPPNRTKSDQNDALHLTVTRGQYSPSLSIGYGRVRDASGVYEAYLLEKRLTETGALSRGLSAAARGHVAALYTIGPAYYAAHDRPARFFWRDLETILRDDGALSEKGLDAYSVQRLEEPNALGNVFLRRVGFHVGPTLSGQHLSEHRRWSYSSEAASFVGDTLLGRGAYHNVSLQETSGSHVQAGIVAEYHRPLGMRAQLDASTSVLFPTKKRDRGISASTGVRLDYSLSDRLRTGVGFDHIRIIQEQGLPNQESRWGVLARASIEYYVEDRLRLSLATAEQRQEAHNNMSISTSYRDRSIMIGLTYDLMGRLDADGLIAPMRRLDQAPPGY